MRFDKQKAIELRKHNKSYGEISLALNVPKSTLSNWLSKTNWSKQIKKILTKNNNTYHSARMKALDKIRGNSLKKIYKQALYEAREEFEYFKYHPLFLAGIALYWGEGNKASPYNVVLGNVDPRMIKVFITFLKKICGLSNNKIRAYILLYPDLNDSICKAFWIKNSGLKEENFNKSVLIKGRHKTRKLQYGVCTITVSSKYLKQKMLYWLELLSQNLNHEYYADIV